MWKANVNIVNQNLNKLLCSRFTLYLAEMQITLGIVFLESLRCSVTALTTNLAAELQDTFSNLGNKCLYWNKQPIFLNPSLTLWVLYAMHGISSLWQWIWPQLQDGNATALLLNVINNHHILAYIGITNSRASFHEVKIRNITYFLDIL